MDAGLFWIFLTGFVATFLSSMSGGGSSIIAIPIYLAMGIPLLTAVAIQQVAAVFWVLPAARNYLRGRTIEWNFLIISAAIGSVGAVLGVLFLTHLPRRTFEICFGLIIIVLVVWLWLNKKFGLTRTKVPQRKKKWSLAPMLPLGAYEIVFGSGNGIMFSLVGVKLRGYDIGESLGYYYAAAFPWVILGAVLLVWNGHYNVAVMAAAVLGSFAGGYFGSLFGRYKGNAFVKTCFCIIGFVLGLKLLFG